MTPRMTTAINLPLSRQHPLMKRLKLPRLSVGRLGRLLSLQRLFGEPIYLAPF